MTAWLRATLLAALVVGSAGAQPAGPPRLPPGLPGGIDIGPPRTTRTPPAEQLRALGWPEAERDEMAREMEEEARELGLPPGTYPDFGAMMAPLLRGMQQLARPAWRPAGAAPHEWLLLGGPEACLTTGGAPAAGRNLNTNNCPVEVSNGFGRQPRPGFAWDLVEAPAGEWRLRSSHARTLCIGRGGGRAGADLAALMPCDSAAAVFAIERMPPGPGPATVRFRHQTSGLCLVSELQLGFARCLDPGSPRIGTQGWLVTDDTARVVAFPTAPALPAVARREDPTPRVAALLTRLQTLPPGDQAAALIRARNEVQVLQRMIARGDAADEGGALRAASAILNLYAAAGLHAELLPLAELQAETFHARFGERNVTFRGNVAAAFALLGEALAQLGRHDDAAGAWRRALAEAPREELRMRYSVRLQEALAAAAQGERAEAALWAMLEDHDRLRSVEPTARDSRTSRFLRGDILTIPDTPVEWIFEEARRRAARVLARLYADRGWPRDAEMLLRAALDSANPANVHPLYPRRNAPSEIAPLLVDLARVARLSGDTATARQRLAATGRWPVDDATRTELLIERAHIAAAAGERDAALAEITDAARVFEARLRAARRFGSDAEAARRQAEIRLAELIELARAQGGEAATETIFRLLQLRRSAAVALAAERRAVRLSGGPPGLQAEIQRLQVIPGRIAALDERLRDTADMQAVARLQAEIAALEREQASLETRLRAAAPRFAETLLPAPAAIAGIRARLAPEEALLLLAVMPERSYAAVVTADRPPEIHPLPIGEEELRARVATLRGGLIAGGAFDLAASAALYRDLLGPVEAALQGRTRWLVVPEGPLLSLPLGVLLTAPPARPDDLQGAPWLARRVAIRTLPSPALLTAATAPDAPLPAYLGIGDPPLPEQPQAAPVPALDALPGGSGRRERAGAGVICAQPPLPGTRVEITGAAGLFHPSARQVLLREAATKDALRRGLAAGPQLVHFATHALLGPESPNGEPGIVMAPDCGSEEPGPDAFLAASEISGLSLAGSVVLLSACNTGGGGEVRDGRAEGLSGLALAFQNAGARDLLLTHWYVDDAAAARLVLGTLALARGRDGQAARPLDEALAAAQRAMMARADTAHPYYWGPLALVGLGGAL